MSATVLVLLRADVERRPGGDVLHAREAAEAGERLGFRVRVEAGVPGDLRGVDLVHVWNVTRPQDAWAQARAARARGVPVVLTPLHHDLGRYLREGRRGLAGAVARLAGSEEAAEACRRAVLRVVDPAQRGLLRGVPGWAEQRRDLLRWASMATFTCPREERELLRATGLDPGSVPSAVVPTAVPAAPPADPGPARRLAGVPGPFVLCVGRIEDLKNPLGVIDALEPTGLPLVLVGPGNPRHRGYVERLAARTSPGRTVWLGYQPPEMVRSAMAGARVHVLASWAESVGRVTLEAALQGCALVSTTAGYAADLLGDAVLPCDPGDPRSIAAAVTRAWEAGPHPAARGRVMAGLTWDAVGPALARAWQGAMGVREASRRAI
ncbi:glycosyltransferase family 4 protein [Myxococcota bacterium]|nr:glycosyltransferase family 4 protein [Myxococcota bacterium]